MHDDSLRVRVLRFGPPTAPSHLVARVRVRGRALSRSLGDEPGKSPLDAGWDGRQDHAHLQSAPATLRTDVAQPGPDCSFRCEGTPQRTAPGLRPRTLRR